MHFLIEQQFRFCVNFRLSITFLLPRFRRMFSIEGMKDFIIMIENASQRKFFWEASLGNV